MKESVRIAARTGVQTPYHRFHSPEMLRYLEDALGRVLPHPITGMRVVMPRSLWNGTVTFGMVNVPVKLYTATESKTVRFHEVHQKDGAPIQHRRICPKDNREVPADQVVKGYEVEPDKHVVLSKEENLPFVVIEALACGCPVLGRRIGGIGEMYQDAHHGRLMAATAGAADYVAAVRGGEGIASAEPAVQPPGALPNESAAVDPGELILSDVPLSAT